MNKISTINPAQNKLEQYVPITIFKEVFNQQTQFPYPTFFSFRSLLDDWEEKHKASETTFEGLEHLKKLAGKVKIDINGLELEKFPEVSNLADAIFPGFFFKKQMGFVSIPFNKNFLYQTPKLVEFLTSEDIEIKIPEFAGSATMSGRKTIEAGIILLNHFYNQELELPFREILHLRDKKTGLTKHYKFNIILDYLQPKNLKPLKKLSQQQIQNLLDNMEDQKLWTEAFPIENFAFEGFVIGFVSDVTDMEILSQLKAKMVEETASAEGDQLDVLEFLQKQMRSLLKMPDIHTGFTQVHSGAFFEHNGWSICRNLKDTEIGLTPNTYEKVVQTEAPVIINDLKKLDNCSSSEQRLKDWGCRSLLLSPLIDGEGKFVGIFELASKKAFQFSNFTLVQLKDVITLFTSGMERSINEMDKQIDLVMKQQFTSIHPSVEWKFNQVASKFMIQQQIDSANAVLEPIVFKNIFPIYGQADIVSSSKLRNYSIEADLIDNLERLQDLIEACLEEVSFHLLDVYLNKIELILNRLQKGAFISSDESQVVELLTKKVHPLIRQLEERFPQLPAAKIKAYFDYLDPDLHIVYRKRKDYEDSVTMLNNAMGAYMEKEDQKMQEILPHFFEKYKTDGVEYNIYLGQELLEKETFSNFFLQDFRIWQLVHMCELTRLVEKQSKELPVPLTTAQLIFVYNNALSIRFRMDEKQFDVDGAYNVRYEILKKRIDKAVIKGTKERLTQSGKVAIVWLQEKDRIEYLEYLQHLLQRGYITDDIEELELEKLQGAEGLKALRVTVKV